MGTQYADRAATALDGTDRVLVYQGDITGKALMSDLATFAQVLTSPDGTQFALTVADDGTLTAEEVV